MFRTGMSQQEMFKQFLDRDCRDQMPALQFPSDWRVKIIPPFGGVLIRFTVEGPRDWISVYLDACEALGSMGEPYWEMYPNPEGDAERFLLNETTELFAAIQRALDAQNQPSTRILQIDEKWSILYDAAQNDKPIEWLRYGAPHSEWCGNNADFALFHALLAEKEK